MTLTKQIVIIGGGFTGAAAAIQLVRASPTKLNITIIEPRETLGQGVAHGADDPDHRLNAPTAGHFIDPRNTGALHRWCIAEGLADRDPDAMVAGLGLFIRRRDFGRFVSETLAAQATAPNGSRILHVRDNAVDIVTDGHAIVIETEAGRHVPADLVIIATGFAQPRLPFACDPTLATHPGLITSPNDLSAIRAIPQAAKVLVVGAGLTALDVLSSMLRGGHHGPITAISRHGLRPVAQRPNPPPALPAGTKPLDIIDGPVAPFIAGIGTPPTIASLFRALRQRIAEIQAEGDLWYTAFDNIRDVLWQIWPGMTISEKQRFQRHLRSWYDTRRFRAPPQNDAMVRAAEAEGRLVFRAARITNARLNSGQIAVTLQDGAPGEALFDTVINCAGFVATGPSRNGFLAALVNAGLVRPDPGGIGLAVDASCRPVAANGQGDDRLRVFGPPSAGHFGDPIGVPFIAAQIARAMPAMLANLAAPSPQLAAD